jgi:hypothetical protein
MKTVACAGAFALLLTASAAAKPATAITTVNLRAEANTTSAILSKIPGGSRIEIGDCTEGWCTVTFQGQSGFAIATALDTTGRGAPRAVRRALPPGVDPDDDFTPVGRPYPRPPGYVVGPPGYGPPVVYGPGPYYYGGPGPYWGGYYGPRWGWGWRRW